MTLKDQILKYEFDTVVPDLLTVDEPVKDNLYAFKEAFDELWTTSPTTFIRTSLDIGMRK